MIIINC